MLFVAKNRILLKTKNSKVLIIFQMVSLKCLLTVDKLMPELHLKQAGLTYSNGRPFTKYCKTIQKFREAGNLKHLYRN